MSREALESYFKGQHIEASVPNGSYRVKLSPPSAVEESKCWKVLETYFDIQLASEDKSFGDYKIKAAQDCYYVADLNPTRLKRIRWWARFYRACLIACFVMICFIHFLFMPLAQLNGFF